jgi:hypothetical protein
VGAPVTAIGDGAFQSCDALASVSLPAARTIGEGAFLGCTTLATVSLPAATTIGEGAFLGCTTLATVSLPAATSIGVHAFSYTGPGPLAVPLGTAVPTLGTGMSLNGGETKSVTVKVPSDATAWDSIVTGSLYNETSSYTDNWGNGFRGGGWDETGHMIDDSKVNSNITLTVERDTP